MRTRVWKGYHSTEAAELIAGAWSTDAGLLVLCPPDVDPAIVPRDLDESAFPEAPVLGLFTSGTQGTGLPGERRKLVIYSKANIRASLNGILDFLGPDRLDSIFCYPQPFHTFGLLLGYVLSLEKGWPLFTGEGKYSAEFHARWLELSTQRRKLLTLGTPTHFRDLISHLAEGRKNAPGPTECCIIGGAKVTASLWKQVRDELRIERPSIGYGATEASPGISHLPAGMEPREDGEIGFLLKNAKISGEGPRGFTFRGPSVCMARVALSGDGPARIELPSEIHVADEISLREDGVWVYRGRADLVLNRGGSKFPLAEIEAVLSGKLGVEVMALAVPHERLGQELGLLIAGCPGDTASILGILRGHYSMGFDPSLFFWVPKIPLNENFKPDREIGLAALLQARDQSDP